MTAINSTISWTALPEVPQHGIQGGDVLIKHVFDRTEFVETAIRAGNLLHVFDHRGSKTAEHVAMVGTSSTLFKTGALKIHAGQVHLVEAVSAGILARNEAQNELLWRSNYYTLFRAPDPNFAYISNGLATRLFKNANHDCVVEEVHQAGAGIKASLVPFVSKAHETPAVAQKNRYGYGNMATSALPNLIPDFISRHDLKVLQYIQGTNSSIAYVCSALIASALQAWRRHTTADEKRLFVDPAQVHPCAVEHQLLGEELGWKRVGRWGKQAKSAADKHAAHAL
ncbi:hypothetical protein OV208_18210 [Corallococcus sp. bb12-1]|uniref:hypothetical protein n=1 Tax=Corallococcus sp. bb12-1 TaxID=2996784 RepID=UPI00226EB576|nr:hypothetical protein [Corallococcus sp. bb12-1]MCY1043257.1 hypothetical protein [Corallococcus sp. bb12-1]